MKKTIYTILMISLSYNLLIAQEEIQFKDKVILLDGTQLKGKITESNENEIILDSDKIGAVVLSKTEISKYYQYFENNDAFIWINKDHKQTAKVVFEDEEAKIISNKYAKVKEYGLNIASLISQFVPFGRSSTATGPYNFTFRLGRGANLFHFQLGADISSGDFFSDVGHINLALGYMRKTAINNKFRHYQFADLMIFSGSFNQPGATGDEFLDNGGSGLGLGLGVEYEIYKNLNLGTETILYIGSPTLTFISPVSVYLIARFER